MSASQQFPTKDTVAIGPKPKGNKTSGKGTGGSKVSGSKGRKTTKGKGLTMGNGTRSGTMLPPVGRQ